MKRKIKYLSTKVDMYIACKKGQFIQVPGYMEGYGYNECSIKYIRYGRYLVGFYNPNKSGNYISSHNQDMINQYKIYTTNSITEIVFK